MLSRLCRLGRMFLRLFVFRLIDIFRRMLVGVIIILR